MIRGDHEDKFFLSLIFCIVLFKILFKEMKINVSTLQLRVICCQNNVNIMSIWQKWFLQF